MSRSPLQNFKLAVFDVAGTTVIDGDAVVDCVRAALDSRVSVSRDAVVEVMGLPKPVAIRRLLVGAGFDSAGLDAAVEEAHSAFRRAMIIRYRDGAIEPAPDAENVFATLREAGVHVALDTGFSRDILDIVLSRLNWSGGRCIDTTIASDEVERGRPFPDLIHRAMALAKVTEPGMVVKVGDTPADLEEGLAARCGCVVGVTYGTHSREQLARPGVRIIDRLAELPAMIGVATP